MKNLSREARKKCGEWLDKEPRADGKPRRWKPFEILTLDPNRLISQPQEGTPSHLLEDIRLHAHKDT